MRVTWLVAVILLTGSPAPAQDPLVADVQALAAAQSNDERFTALTAMLRARGVAFTVEPFTIDKQVGSEPRTAGRNVVTVFGDGVGQGADEVVLGAHYDAARLADGSLSKGAVDNAASAVMLAGVAEALRSGEPQRSGEVLPAGRVQPRVRIVWFDMEEIGLAGSARYLQAHKTDRIRAMLNFDINAYGDTVVFGAPSGGDDPRLRRLMTETCAELGNDCLRFAAMPPGDDRTFGAAGIATLSIAHLPALEAHQLWLMLHAGASSGLAPGVAPPIFRTIHTADDVPSKVDGTTIVRAQRLALALLQKLMRAPN